MRECSPCLFSVSVLGCYIEALQLFCLIYNGQKVLRP